MYQAKQPIFRKIIGAPFRVTLDPIIRDVAVSREYLADQFGALKRQSFTKPTQGFGDDHCYDHFVFLHKRGSPQVPYTPGGPGLVTHFKERPWPAIGLYRVFVRVSEVPARWQYMGLYKATELSAWTTSEVKNQSTTIKHFWAGTLRDCAWGRPTLARIALRKGLGREPTEAEVMNQVRKLRKKSVERPSSKMIREAFENGDEKVYPWKLECQGYEENLQWEIAVTWPHYRRELPERTSGSRGH